MIRAIFALNTGILTIILSACSNNGPIKYSCPVEINAAGKMTSGTETFTYFPKGMLVQDETMEGGVVKTVNLPATVSGDILSFQTLSSSPIFYKLNLKTLVLNLNSTIWNPSDGSLLMTGTGTCSAGSPDS